LSSSRSEVKAVLRGERLARRPVFSGLPSLTASGLRMAGVEYHAAHTDACLMAAAAASTYALYGFESAVVPFDLCVEAEALGCTVDFQTDVDSFLAPVIDRPLAWDAWQPSTPRDLFHAGRIPLVVEAVRMLKRDVGGQIAIGAWVPGPFTLAWQLFGAEVWLGGLAEIEKAMATLVTLADVLSQVGREYIDAGADFLTIHEMGGSPQVIGAKHFQTFIMPPLKCLIAALPAPRVLSICGTTDSVVADMAATGADALHLDHRNDLARTRRLLGREAVLFGNFDPIATLSHGTPAGIIGDVQRISAAGANAIWPGCDLWPQIPDENFRSLMVAARDVVI
jgi:[methyl-Co(III) methanol-specific corrinoid protein]:coenzyme M methyltransferase